MNDDQTNKTTTTTKLTEGTGCSHSLLSALYHELEDHGIAPVHFKCSSKVFTTAKASGESEEAIGNAQQQQ